MSDDVGDFVRIALTAIVVVAVFISIGACKQWQYDECVAVGHSQSYCIADSLGCFSKNR